MSYAYATQNERTMSGAMALVMHLLFLLLLVFGVSWQHKQSDSAVIVDLWNDLPALPQPKAAPPPEVKKLPEVKKPPEPPKPVPKVEPKPEPKPVIKPDIALKEKLEKERKLKAEQARLEEKKREEIKREREKREKEKAQAALKEKLEKERRQKEQDDALRKLNAQAVQAAQAAAARGKVIDKYMGLIRDKIKRNVVEPLNLKGNPEVEFDVVLLPGGEVLSVKLRKSSGVVAYDNAVERAILKTHLLPLPPDPSLFSDFRELKLKFRPKE